MDICLRMLGERGRIDIFECARRDPSVPLEETLGALAELVNEGKIGGVALSEVSADTTRRAAKDHEDCGGGGGAVAVADGAIDQWYRRCLC